MSLWQEGLIFLGLIVAAVLLGLLLGYIILRLKKRPWPYARASQVPNNGHSISPEPTAPVFRVVEHFPVKKAESTADRQKALEEFVKKRQPTPASVNEPVKAQKSDLLAEVEANLAIATSPWTGMLVPFQTKVLDANRNRIDSLIPEFRDQLTEAYTDMHLANTLVWLSMDVGHRSRDLDESYLKLCNKIAERLQKSVAPLTRSGI